MQYRRHADQDIYGFHNNAGAEDRAEHIYAEYANQPQMKRADYD